MFSQEKLWNLVEAELRASQDARHASTETAARERQFVEIATLTRHLAWIKEAGDDQMVLEKIISSLEESTIVRYQAWRELSTVKPSR